MKKMNYETWCQYLQPNSNLPIEHTPNEIKPKIDIHLSKIPPLCVKVLDLGAGDGYASSVIIRGNKKVTSTSINPKEVSYMKKLGMNAFLEDMHALSFDDSSFDCVYARQVIEHALAPFIVFSEISRVLKNNGCFILIVPPETDVFMSDERSIYMHNSASKHYSVLTEIQLKTLWNKVGFTIKDKWVLKTPHGTDVAYLLQKEN